MLLYQHLQFWVASVCHMLQLATTMQHCIICQYAEAVCVNTSSYATCTDC